MNDQHDWHPSEDQLRDFLDRRLDALQAQKVERHIESCQPCGRLFHQITLREDLLVKQMHQMAQGGPPLSAKEQTEPPPELEQNSPQSSDGGNLQEPTAPTSKAPTVPPDHAELPRNSSMDAQDLPKEFGDYELIQEIARGGMGVVFKAKQKKANRIVALKMVLTGMLAGQEEIQRFYVEVEAAAHLDHPYVVPIFDVGQQNGQHYFSMGYIDGPSLKDVVRDGPLPCPKAAELVKKIADGIAYAHEEGIIHRDLKPANILLDKQGNPRITDFGLAKQIKASNNLTKPGQIMGTPAYMSPEQAAGKLDEIAEPADVYAIGAILYELLSGRPPFQASSDLETLIAVMENPPVRLRELNPEVDNDLETICLKCLAKAPKERYPSAQGLADALRRFLHGELLQQDLLKEFRERPPRPLRETKPDLRRWGHRKMRRAALFGIAALAVGTLAVAIWPGGRTSPESAASGNSPLTAGRSGLSLPARPDVRRVELYVRRQRDDSQIESYSMVLESAEESLRPIAPLEPHDGLLLEVEFSLSAHWYLVHFDPAGAYVAIAHSQAPAKKIQFPPQPASKTRFAHFSERDSRGVNVLLLITSSKAKGQEALNRLLRGGLGKQLPVPTVLPAQWGRLREGLNDSTSDTILPGRFVQQVESALPAGDKLAYVLFLPTR